MDLHKFLKSYKQYNFWKTSPSELNPNYSSDPKNGENGWNAMNQIQWSALQKLASFFSLHLMLARAQKKVQSY